MAKNKAIGFIIRGKRYEVNHEGYLRRADMKMDYSPTWKFLGVSFHHWRQNIDIHLQEALKYPERLVGGRVWDEDHGTIRLWSGRYNGKLPRITSAYSLS